MAGFTRTATPRATARATTGTTRQMQKIAPIDRRKVQTPTQPIRKPRNVTR